MAEEENKSHVWLYKLEIYHSHRVAGKAAQCHCKFLNFLVYRNLHIATAIAGFEQAISGFRHLPVHDCAITHNSMWL